MDKPKQIVKVQETERIVDTGAGVKELEDRLLKLRIENAFKELRRLRLEDEAK